jgi:ABC-2 type transport system ATP-binding protein
MKQKIVMAGNILHDPDIYIVDEPMVGLDPKSAKIVKEIFIDLGKAGKTLFISTHSLEIVESLCHTIGIIMNGKMIAKGTIKEVKEMAKTEKSGLEDIFLSLTGSPDLSNVLEYIK